MKYAVTAAYEAPQTAPILLTGDLSESIRRAAEMGFDAIEWHGRPDQLAELLALKDFMAEQGIAVSALVSGRLFTEWGFNLLDHDPAKAKEAVDYFKTYIDHAETLQTDIILGWAKGKKEAEESEAQALARLALPLKELSDYATARGVRILIEAINHKEVNLFCSGKAVMDFINQYDLTACYVHLDTYHMATEAQDMAEQLEYCKSRLGYMHFATGAGRVYPRAGDTDFATVLRKLQDVGYSGYYAIECLPLPDASTAATEGLKYLKNEQ